MKTCTKCGETKPLADYSKRKASKDGLQFQCKSCNRETNHEYREQNHDQELKRHHEYREQNRDRERERVHEWRQNNRERKLEYDREYHREWYQNNRERKLESNREWYQNNPEKRLTYDATRRAREQGNLTKVDQQQSAEYRKMLQGTPCHYCGTAEGPFHVDHKQPLSRGGTDHWTNLVQACQDCNLSKGSKTYEEFTGTPDLTHYCVQS